jgi:Pao retrotransposon peptidase
MDVGKNKISCIKRIIIQRKSSNRGFCLVAFSDASPRSYSCCFYLYFNHEEKGNLIFAKERNHKRKGLTIPRAEFAGALLILKYLGTIRTTINFKGPVKIFTDSQIVLAWITVTHPNILSIIFFKGLKEYE